MAGSGSLEVEPPPPPPPHHCVILSITGAVEVVPGRWPGGVEIALLLQQLGLLALQLHLLCG